MNCQVNNALQHIFFFLLIIAGIVISQQNVVQLGHVDSSQLDSMTFCQQISDANISNQSGDVAPLFDDASKSNAKDTQSKTITSCNSLANMLPSENSFSFSSAEQSVNIGFHNALLSSQIFVFQEPDPPRIG
jgi:hypothetical protein